MTKVIGWPGREALLSAPHDDRQGQEPEAVTAVEAAEGFAELSQHPVSLADALLALITRGAHAPELAPGANELKRETVALVLGRAELASAVALDRNAVSGPHASPPDRQNRPDASAARAAKRASRVRSSSATR